MVTDGDLEAEAIAEAGLQLMLPPAVAGAVAATAIGQDEQTVGRWIAPLACARPPPRERGGGEGRRVVGGPDEDTTNLRG